MREDDETPRTRWHFEVTKQFDAARTDGNRE